MSEAPSDPGRVSGPGLPHSVDAATSRTHDGPRFMLYSHDGYGLGHFRRNLVIARALTEARPQANVLLACAAEGIETFSMPAGVDFLRLPGLRKVANGRYVGRRLALEQGELVSLRAGVLAAAVAGFRPDVLLADKHPLGVRGELVPALNRLSHQGGRAALGLRDVLDDGRTTRDEWQHSGLGRRAAELYELILVYGSAALLDPVVDDLLPARSAPSVRYCGYVVGTAPATESAEQLPAGDNRPVVLATVGGGEDGLPLLETFIEASRGAGWRAVVVSGPQMASDDWHRLRQRAEDAGATPYRSVRQIQRWYGNAGALVCMGGYNTLVEALAAPVPTICVPRTQPRREQQIRARAFAARGLLEVVEASVLSAPALRAAVERALRTPREVLAERVRRVLDLGGAERAAHHLIQLAEAGAVEPIATIGVPA